MEVLLNELEKAAAEAHSVPGRILALVREITKH
jgi:hypothetical protein